MPASCDHATYPLTHGKEPPWTPGTSSTATTRARSPSASSDGPRVSYLRDWVYGGIDGTVTTFAVVAGVVGAELSTKALLILGAANLIADGFSMAAANYSGTKAEIEEYEQVRRMEERHVDIAPEGEREEIRQIFQAKGFEGEALDSAVDVITGSANAGSTP